MKFLAKKLEPKINEPNIWVFILSTKDDMKAATSFATSRMKEYDCVQSTYVPSKAEMLNNVSNRCTAPDVPLLFLFKKDNEFATSSRKFIKSAYGTPSNNPYYSDASKLSLIHI